MSSMAFLSTLIDQELAVLQPLISSAKFEAHLYIPCMHGIPNTIFFVLLSVYSWQVLSYEFL